MQASFRCWPRGQSRPSACKSKGSLLTGMLSVHHCWQHFCGYFATSCSVKQGACCCGLSGADAALLPPPADLILFTATANLSIVSLNLSLMLNPVGFYQVGPIAAHGRASAAVATSQCSSSACTRAQMTATFWRSSLCTASTRPFRLPAVCLLAGFPEVQWTSLAPVWPHMHAVLAACVAQSLLQTSGALPSIVVALAACTSTRLSGLHLLLQIAKLLIIPFVCIVEKVWLGRVFTRGVLAAVMVVVTGWPLCECCCVLAILLQALGRGVLVH